MNVSGAAQPPGVKITDLFVPGAWVFVKGTPPTSHSHSHTSAAKTTPSSSKRKAHAPPSDGSPSKRHVADSMAVAGGNQATMISIRRGGADESEAVHSVGNSVVMVRVRRGGADDGASFCASGAVDTSQWAGNKVSVRRVLDGGRNIPSVGSSSSA